MSCFTASAELIREELKATATIVCVLGKNTLLLASDGVLYDSDQEPIFITE